MSSIQTTKSTYIPLIIALVASTMMFSITFAYIDFMIYDISYGMSHAGIKQLLYIFLVPWVATTLYLGWKERKNANITTAIVMTVSVAIIFATWFLVIGALDNVDVPFLNACQTLALMDAMSFETCMIDIAEVEPSTGKKIIKDYAT